MSRARQFVERQIAMAVVKAIKATGQTMFVEFPDGEAISEKWTTDEAAIMADLFAGDDARLRLGRGGWVLFVYGNDDGENVICDNSASVEPLLKHATELSDYWGGDPPNWVNPPVILPLP